MMVDRGDKFFPMRVDRISAGERWCQPPYPPVPDETSEMIAHEQAVVVAAEEPPYCASVGSSDPSVSMPCARSDRGGR
jgi:hypothetical protein